jgi:Cu/Ag efflux pump CusA
VLERLAAAGGGHDLGELRALQDSYVRPQLAAVPGVLADSAIVMTEHAHARLHASAEGGVVRGDQREVALRACLRVGRPLFFSVLITMASFLPVLALGGMEGRLFRPLALTKLFALAAAAVLAVTLVPALIPTFVRGRLRGEERNPLVRSVAAVYRRGDPAADVGAGPGGNPRRRRGHRPVDSSALLLAAQGAPAVPDRTG